MGSEGDNGAKSNLWDNFHLFKHWNMRTEIMFSGFVQLPYNLRSGIYATFLRATNSYQ